MVATSRLLYNGTSAPNDISDSYIFLVCGYTLSLEARSLEINDLLDPLSNKILLPMLVSL